MAVYTEVSDEELRAFLGAYALGDLLTFKGIAEGVENSNFLLGTSSGNYVLTLYEKRVHREDLPFFLGLMEHLASRGIACPLPVKAADGTVLPAGVQLGLGVRTSAVSMDVEQGSLRATGGELDIAIEGNGYLEIIMPDGTSAYTRDGTLKRNGEGLIVTSDGFPVAPEITIPNDAVSISINAEGEVYAYFRDDVAGQLLDRFNLVSFVNQKGLEAIGGNLYLETEASGPAEIGDAGVDGRGIFRAGYLEDSAVDPVREITRLIEAQRGYELNAKVITAVDQMMSATAQVR